MTRADKIDLVVLNIDDRACKRAVVPRPTTQTKLADEAPGARPSRVCVAEDAKGSDSGGCARRGQI